MIERFEPCAQFWTRRCLAENVPCALRHIVNESSAYSPELSRLTCDLGSENAGTSNIFTGRQIGVI